MVSHAWHATHQSSPNKSFDGTLGSSMQLRLTARELREGAQRYRAILRALTQNGLLLPDFDSLAMARILRAVCTESDIFKNQHL